RRDQLRQRLRDAARSRGAGGGSRREGRSQAALSSPHAPTAPVPGRQHRGSLNPPLSFDSLYADLVLAWRRLLKTKVASTAAILSLSVGIGACLTAFQLVNALLLRPLPIADPDRLYVLSRREFRSDGPPITRDSWQQLLLRDLRDAVANQGALISVSEVE